MVKDFEKMNKTTLRIFDCPVAAYLEADMANTLETTKLHVPTVQVSAGLYSYGRAYLWPCIFMAVHIYGFSTSFTIPSTFETVKALYSYGPILLWFYVVVVLCSCGPM